MDPQRVERIRKRREEDDEEFMFLLLPILHFHQMGSRGQMEKRQRHSSVLYGKHRVEQILEGHVKNCRVAYRMEAHIFKSLASYLRREKLLEDKRIKIEEKLAFFLYMLSHNASFEDLQLEFQHSNRTFHTCIKEFFNIIPVLSRSFLKPPNIDQPHPKIANDDRFYPYFQNCIGAIDGSHVPVSVSPHLAAPFRNRKGTLSHNVMIACDFDLNVTYISCGWEGSATDARVLRSAMNKGFKVPNGKFYLVDGGYANTESFLAPYLVDDDLQILDGGEGPAQRGTEVNPVIEVDDAGEKVGNEQQQHNQKKVARVPKKKPNKSDAMVEAVDRYVTLKQKQAEEEKAESNAFSIPKCISALQNMKDLRREERVKASKLFKIIENRETFLTWAAQDEELAVMWLRGELQELP